MIILCVPQSQMEFVPMYRRARVGANELYRFNVAFLGVVLDVFFSFFVWSNR